MSTTPRIPPELARGFTMLTEGGDTPAARIAIPAELTRLAGIPIASEGSLQIDPLVHECIRIFNAKYQGCQYCMNARAAGAVQAGLDEDMVEQLRDFERGTLPEKVKAALRITSAVSSAPQMVTPALLDAARAHFGEQELIDIVLLSVFTTGSKVAITLGIDPGREASSRVFYPAEAVYGNSPQLRDAVEAMAARGLKVSAEDGLAYQVKTV
jgi:AhpD family alkylhydroperoxidase